jgi:hypothetical protein
MDLEVEGKVGQIRELIAAGSATEQDTIEVDGRTAWATAAACRSTDRRTRLLFRTRSGPQDGQEP